MEKKRNRKDGGPVEEAQQDNQQPDGGQGEDCVVE